MCPSLDVLVPALLEAGWLCLCGRGVCCTSTPVLLRGSCACFHASGPSRLGEMCQLKPGVPIKPMLAKAADGVDDVLRTMAGAGALLAEYKYDGQRAQVHLLEGGQAREAHARLAP